MDEVVLKDVSALIDTDEVRELLLQLEYPPEIREEKTDQIVSEYRGNPQQPFLGVEWRGEIVGLIGLALGADGSAVIRHIVVRRDRRGGGIGRGMIAAAARKYALERIYAETDHDAVEFYRKCGFGINSLGEKYPGTERFWCTLSGAVQPGVRADAGHGLKGGGKKTA